MLLSPIKICRSADELHGLLPHPAHYDHHDRHHHHHLGGALPLPKLSSLLAHPTCSHQSHLPHHQQVTKKRKKRTIQTKGKHDKTKIQKDKWTVISASPSRGDKKKRQSGKNTKGQKDKGTKEQKDKKDNYEKGP